ncbi:MAG: flippase-like domain-containing protein [Spirochaetes bacterium]|nr:flippase-like domain-containing protein [Spirochaetota bacterium]
MKAGRGPGWGVLFRFAFAAALIALLIHFDRFDFRRLLKLRDPAILWPGLGMIGGVVFLQAWRWRILVLAQSLELTVWAAFKLTLIGVFFNQALPGSVSGDVVKAFTLGKLFPDRQGRAWMTVLMDRLLGVYVLVALAATVEIIFFPLVRQKPELMLVTVLTWILILAMSIFWIIAFSNRFRFPPRIKGRILRVPGGRFLIKCYEYAHDYRYCRRAVLGSVFFGFLSQILGVGFAIFIGISLGDGGINPAAYFFAVPLGSVIQIFPVSPGGIGVGQIAYLYFFQLYTGQHFPIGETIASASQIASFLWGLFGAVIYLFIRKPSATGKS